MCRFALRGCGRRCRRRLSGIWPSRGAKAELRFWRARSAANRGTMTHDLFLFVGCSSAHDHFGFAHSCSLSPSPRRGPVDGINSAPTKSSQARQAGRRGVSDSLKLGAAGWPVPLDQARRTILRHGGFTAVIMGLSCFSVSSHSSSFATAA